MLRVGIRAISGGYVLWVGVGYMCSGWDDCVLWVRMEGGEFVVRALDGD